LSLRKQNFVVDPLAEIDLGPMLAALAEKSLVLHGADFDLRLMRSSFGFRPQGEVFDTMLAAQLLGYERIGYAALVEQFTAVVLAKTGQKSNWARRPLTAEQLRYAADDTRFLFPVARELRKRTEAIGPHRVAPGMVPAHGAGDTGGPNSRRGECVAHEGPRRARPQGPCGVARALALAGSRSAHGGPAGLQGDGQRRVDQARRVGGAESARADRGRAFAAAQH
jgi:hypothetical protein